ncbi:MAG: Nif3-like dinuclear metal center hexameric protein [Rubricoccaceae bacterium]|nr:Nif3-like dinuclear metal center hexameric protein [Rubricoccaceae bacterium]
MPSVAEIARALEAWAPPASKLDYDNVGLQVGDPQRDVAAVLVALDLTPDVVAEARDAGADLVVTHHPLLFRPLQRLTADDPVGALALRLAEAGLAYYAIHTNLDAAPGGVSFALAERLGLADVRFLEPSEGALVKLVTFAPADHAEVVRRALAEAGAGRIGDYEACAFTLRGTGHFRPGAGADPFIGEAGGGEEAVEEVRIEAEVMRWDLGRVVRAMRAAHPYEAVAYDVYPVEQPATRVGFGAVGHLPQPAPLDAFLRVVAERLGAAALRYSGDPQRPVETVAVCGGAGASLLGRALAAGADAYVTADVTYHRFFEPLGADGRARMALIDAGHYETEALTEGLLVDWLGARFPGLTVRATRHRTSPMQTFVPER